MKFSVYTPPHYRGYEYVIKRNENLARYLAKIYNGDYVTSLNIGEKNNYVLINSHINQDIYKNLGSPAFYGGVTNDLYTLKTIFHSPLQNGKNVPANFPMKFAETLEELNYVLPGFSVFTYSELRNAFKVLNLNQKLAVRIKNPILANGEGHAVIHNNLELEKYINKFEKKVDIRASGLVIESNILNSKTFSVGMSMIMGEDYYYIGEQFFEHVGSELLYSGTRLYMSRNINALKNTGLIQESDLVKMLSTVLKLLKIIPETIATRINFDIIYGAKERIDGIVEDPNLYFLEQSFRPGGASGAEFKALDKLINSNLDVAEAQCIVERNNLSRLKPNAFLLYAGTDPIYGYLRISAS